MVIKFFQLLSREVQPPEDPRERIRIATCALLIETASIDDEFTGEERSHLLDTVRDRFHLDDTEAADLLNSAQAARDGSLDLWRFTHSLNELCGISEKIRIIEEVWRMICADGQLDAHEEHLVRRLSGLLNLTHADLIEAKLRIFDEYRNR